MTGPGNGCLGVLMALRHRERTGEGQYVDAALRVGVPRHGRSLEFIVCDVGIVRERFQAFLSSHNDFACPHGIPLLAN
jgi:succinyl-CoA:(S)-malate CoA-transferase subunit B